MDNIYENLDNYDDVNIVEDLKNENKELKMKVEEYSTTMTRLQNEFDKLNGEYKKLQLNYSTLLKTARAEIERKTHMITNLNIEKDSMLLRAMQNNSRHLISLKAKLNTAQVQTNEDKRTPSSNKSVSPAPVVKSEKTKEHKKNNDKHDAYVSKENKYEGRSQERGKPQRDRKDIGKSRRIMDRRKSLPARQAEISPVFSSEDDEKYESLREETKAGKNYNNKRSSIPETTTTRTRFSNQRLYRDPRERLRKENYYNHHSKRLITAEERGKYFRQRSPPSDRYKRNRSRERRAHYVKDQREYDSSPSYVHGRPPMKHKVETSLEEPSLKRVRRESSGHHLSEVVNEREVTDIKTVISPDDTFRSCMSPDHIDSNVSLQHPVKEIMHTSVIPLEDPRMCDKNYILKTENDKVLLSTICCKDIELKVIDKSVWGIAKVIAPDALRELPAPTTDNDIATDIIYRDIDNANLNMTLESGEITSTEDDILFSKFDVDDKCELSKNQTSDTHNKKDICITKLNNKEKESRDLSEVSSIRNFRIPKKEKSKEDEIKGKINLENSGTLSIESQNNKSGSFNPKNNNKNYDLPRIIAEPNKSNSLKNISIVSISKECEQRHKNISHGDGDCVMTKSIGTVEGDLLLSDDNDCDDITYTTRGYQNGDQGNKCVIEVRASKSEISITSNVKNKKENKAEEQINDKRDELKKTTEQKQKSRKKSQDQKSSKTKEPNKDLNTIKKTKSKKDKESKKTEIKTKFSDLFGECSSLITPEDLGIAKHTENKFTEILDDTQSAMDIHVEKVESSAPSTFYNDIHKNVDIPVTVPSQSTYIAGAQVNVPANKCKNTDVSVPVSTSTQEIKVNPELIYKNINADVSMNGSNVIVISTGKQQTCDDELKDNKKIVKHAEPSNNLEQNNVLKAIATSTPYKENITFEDLCIEQSSCRALVNEGTKSAESTINTSSVDTCNDVPDVRIFVKRRRKIKRL
ncbi:uncharacterized protein LOC126967693 isoform X2 [Leptidea sinapis]|uniref:uncharacterized protein LOC126967693 isoform X2 n=1 Tax=Leptidea sinapis TaxID=189913 RepID=UPI0021C2C262|nr:uncharacterized protein LOC126967693 isoform X2 [Leptidea sinapis]